MTIRLPALFVSHGAPTILTDNCPARDFLRQLGRDIGRPRAIVSVTAHWCTREPRVSAAGYPTTMYDFGGFPDELYSLSYRAPGDPVLADRIAALLGMKGIACGKDMSRGLDHGTWVPLMLMYPEADIPVVQLSVQPHLSPAHHAATGNAIQSLRDESILVIASGSATHNLKDFFGRSLDSEPLPYAREFSEWLQDAITGDRRDELLDYVNAGPHAIRNHPTPEHFLPLFVAMGTGGSGTVIHESFTYGAISMAAFSWQ